MFDFAEALGQANLMSGQTNKSAQDIYNAELQANLMGINKSNDPIQNYGNNVLLSHMTNINTNDLTQLDITKNLMFNDK